MTGLMRLVVGAAVAAVLGAPAAAAETTGFTSPSGNIGCILADDLLRCDIAERGWSPPARPADCPDYSDYGQGIVLHQTGPARFVCAGDTAMGGGAVLPYGQFLAGGGMSCNSEPTGMRCSNSEGRGFTISRQAHGIF
ncbi:DUF6636 domain-containing protein [Mycolicibacterium sp. 120270]|uniref:DUF6636 domain-containing protein n=1 Tax=Mycolicibacterium sp. 120270 TaxID=3090600 RepID=UPI00299F3900|nr:DUF6636 domain-containing protein [Mycolicibacterium sp. 120270]MDX1883039.1 DUF6636 domain-containing protein [Mycolicibacterium sp. 120270]